MGLLDRLTGTRRPRPGTPAMPARQLYDAIVALDRDGVPWSIRPGAREHGDLTAEWKTSTGPYTFRYMIVLRFDESHHEVVALDRLWENDGTDGGGRYGQGGNVTRRTSGGTIERDADGKLRVVRTGGVDTRDLKDPIRDLVTASGWTWRQRALKM